MVFSGANMGGDDASLPSTSMASGPPASAAFSALRLPVIVFLVLTNVGQYNSCKVPATLLLERPEVVVDTTNGVST